MTPVKRRFLRIVSVITLSTLAIAPALADPGDIGMHPGTTPGSLPGMNVSALRLWDTGTSWRDIQPNRGTYQWTVLDQWLSAAQNAGITDVMYVLGTTPQWAVDGRATSGAEANGPGYRGAGSAKPPVVADYATFVSQVATHINSHFPSLTMSYEVWNEANLNTYWLGTPAKMAEMTQAAYRAVNAVNTSSLVVAASTTMRGSQYTTFYPAYLKALRGRGWPVDVFAGHFYPYTSNGPSGRVKMITRFKADLRKYRAPRRPIWDTEINYGLRGRLIASSLIPTYVAQTYLDSARLGVAKTYWYIWSPQIYYRENSRDVPVLGIVMQPGSVGVSSLENVHTWLTGTRATLCSLKKGVSQCRFDRLGSPALIAWATTRNGIVRVPTFARYACKFGGSCSTVTPRAKYQITAIPVRFSATP